MIKLTKTVDKQASAVYLVNDAKALSHVPQEYQSLAKEVLASNKNIDYAKNASQYTFVVKCENNLEKLRVAGYTIRKTMDRLATSLYVVGQGEPVVALLEGLALSNYQFLKYFTDRKEREYALESIFLVGDVEETDIKELNNTVKAVSWARDMVNEPVSFLTAEQLAIEIETLGKEAKFDVQVMHKAEIEKLGMGGLLAVNKGSILPPTFTVMEYKPANPINKKPIALVGKGLVYDTGGLSLKPTAGSMDSMKSDMGGAACMIGAIYAAALNKLNVHIIGLIPSTDNRPGQEAYTPGDVIKMYDGTTVEVLNTDAEGRMILGDAIAYANQYDPELIIDAATLTGAAVVVAGVKASCVMGNASDKLMGQLKESGTYVHERLVELPFWDDYKDLLKSKIADMKNIGGRYAGTITAGKFLEHFAKHPYIHIDIAGPAFYEEEVDYKGVGGTGTGVRTLAHFFKNYKG